MLRFCLLSMVLMASCCLPGCGGSSEPEPLDAEQAQQFQERLEEVQNQEQAHFQQQ